MITVPQLDPVSQIQATDVIMITHADGTTEKITGENFMKAMAVDVIAENNMNSVTSNAVAKKLLPQSERLLNLNSDVVEKGSITFYTKGMFRMLRINNLSFKTDLPIGDANILGANEHIDVPAVVPAASFSLPPLNSGESAQYFYITASGELFFGGAYAHLGDYYGSFMYIA